MVLRDKLLNKRGLNLIHPWVAFAYLVVVLVLTMCSVNPLLIITSLLMAIIIRIHTIGFKRFARYIPWLLLIVAITGIGNMCISHNGMHVLFLVNDNRITLEALIYGVVFGLMFAAAFLWCTYLQMIITGEKLTYMFGSFAPGLGLVISMTLHYIPVLRKRMEIVRNAQAGMGRKPSNNIFTRAKMWGREFSIVIAWSLENAIDTSSAMTAMGYGLGKRSSYSNYRFKIVDAVFLGVIIALAIPGFFVTLSVDYRVYYYPTFGMMGDISTVLILWVFYLAYMIIPLILERIIKWH